MTRHLIVFIKAPRLGTVKTRLAADVGWVAATAFQRLTVETVLRCLAFDGRWRCRLAVTPDRDRHAPFWPHGIDRIPQGGGDLGQRMARAMTSMPPGPVVVVGTDVPDLRARHVAAAFRALGDHDAVLGPADDGGYWLIGLSHPRRVPGLFEKVRWSTKHALADTLVNLEGRSVALADTLTDVDDGRSWLATRRYC